MFYCLFVLFFGGGSKGAKTEQGEKTAAIRTQHREKVEGNRCDLSEMKVNCTRTGLMLMHSFLPVPSIVRTGT